MTTNLDLKRFHQHFNTYVYFTNYFSYIVNGLNPGVSVVRVV